MRMRGCAAACANRIGSKKTWLMRCGGSGVGQLQSGDADSGCQCGHLVYSTRLLIIDTSLASQRFTTDCEVCCRPWQVHVNIDPDGRVVVRLDALDE